MRSNPDISLARFLMIVSMVLLGILQYLWLHNEYLNKYRDMETKINHVMFSSVRDVEDSLLFSNLANNEFTSMDDSDRTIKITINADDSVTFQRTPDEVKILGKEVRHAGPHREMRGILLRQLKSDTSFCAANENSMSKMVMGHIRLTDSTDEYAGYHLISWLGEDTMVRGLMSRPQIDAFGEKKMALINPNYKADIFRGILPHISFALFLLVMVGAAFYYIWKNLRKQMQLNALRDEFVSNITHELKTPITTVGVALESLNMSDNLNSTNSRRYLDICQSELKRLSMLVERILHNHAPQIHYEKIDIQQVLDDVMHHMKVQFDNKHAIINVRHRGEGFVINGDKSHMSGVLYNLLENALKYSPSNPVITVNLGRDNGSIKVDIQDNGIGIDPEYHDKIFDKLYRVPQHNRHDVKGHGLGLSYVADVVRKHNGRIDLESEIGKGAKFSMTLPACDASAMN
ncbi:MAG TPA: HAMP domain-containing sensor histidine kinase [Saprospiraceae bacterium]|nr:HAMP domain-containing sensor histidine kinase [Saprospiraceae bacterium]